MTERLPGMSVEVVVGLLNGRRTAMTDKTIDLDKRRGMAAQKATDLRRLLSEVEANEKTCACARTICEAHLPAAPAVSWPEAAEKARYLSDSMPQRSPPRTRGDRSWWRRCSRTSNGSPTNPDRGPLKEPGLSLAAVRAKLRASQNRVE